MRRSATFAAFVLAICCPTSASAQEASAGLARGDVLASLGWFNADKGDLGIYNGWYNRSLFGGAAFGWYWTPHLKTEIDVGATTPAERYSAREVYVGGATAYLPSEFVFSTRRVAIGQQYQFGENAWFHPHLAAGLDLTSERVRQHDERTVLFDPVTRQVRGVIDAVTHPARTERHRRLYVGGGFKAYMTARSFFRSDVRLTLRHGVDEALLRFGFGVDF